MRVASGSCCCRSGAIALFATGASTQSPHFYPDDPIAREPESQDASKAAPYDQSQMYELTYNLFVNSGLQAERRCARRTSTRSTRCRTRAGSRTASAPDRSRTRSSFAARTSARRPTRRSWVLIREKTSGAHPGFTAKDAKGETWFLEFDPPYFAGRGDRRRRGRDQDLLGARLQPGGIVPDDLRSEEGDDRSRRRPFAARAASGPGSLATT